jgi:uncharacterized protein YjbI with pentapeptide repeats
MKQKAALRRRWDTPEGQAMTRQVLQRIRPSSWPLRRGLDGLGIERHGGRLDLRGFKTVLPRSAGLVQAPDGDLVFERLEGLTELEGLRLRGIDFSGAELRHLRLTKCVLEDCLFDYADCRDWRLWRCKVVHCSFVRSDLRDAALGTGPEGGRNTWHGADFSGADLRGSVLHQARFNECTFADTRLDGTAFERCDIAQCRFDGRLANVSFDGRHLRKEPAPIEIEADFSKAYFHNVDFTGYTLCKAALPVDNDIYVVSRMPCVARQVVALIEDDDSMPARQLKGVMSGELRGLSATVHVDERAAMVFNRRDWRAWGGEELLELSEKTIRQAIAYCSTSTQSG